MVGWFVGVFVLLRGIDVCLDRFADFCWRLDCLDYLFCNDWFKEICF